MTEPAPETILRACYALDHAPITFDFGVFLALTDCARQLAERETIDLTILAHEYRDTTPRDKTMSKGEKDWRLSNILLGCCDLLPTLTNYGVARQPNGKEFEFPPLGARFPYLAKDVLRLFKGGANPRCLTAPEHARTLAKVAKRYVTLTLRTSTHFPERNPNLGDWRKFANQLHAEGYGVVVVPDQEDLLGANDAHGFFNEPWIGWARPAALDIRLRMALYQGATMNFCSSNGPAALIFYTDAPVLQFDHLRGSTFTPDKWEALNGIPAGEQFPWSLPTQRMTWKDSTLENLKSEWEAMCPSIPKT